MKKNTSREYLQAIIDYGNFSNAAKALYISQPYLSRYIRDLEDEIGAELVDRSNNPITLTYPGERYLSYMTQIDNLYNEMNHEFDSIINQKKGRIRIGVNPMVGTVILHRILPAYMSEYQDVEIELVEGNTVTEEKMLLQNKIDFSINIKPIFSDDISSVPLYSETLCLIVPYNNHFYLKDRVYSYRPLFEFKELNSEPFILLKEGSGVRKLTEQLFKKHKVVPRVVMETANVLNALNLASAGIGLTIIPHSIIPEDTNLNYNVYKISDPSITSDVILKYRKEDALSSHVLAFFDIAREVLNA